MSTPDLVFKFHERAVESAAQWAVHQNQLRHVCSHFPNCVFSMDHLTKAVAATEIMCIAWRGPAFAGFALLQAPPRGKTLHMSTLFAMSAGRAIVGAVREYGARLGRTWLTIDSTVPPVLFYAKLGFYFHTPHDYRRREQTQAALMAIITRYSHDTTYDEAAFVGDLKRFKCWNPEYQTFSMVLPISH